MKVHVLSEDIPYARYVLRHLRDKNTDVEHFRYWLKRAGIVLGVFLSKELYWIEKTIETPLSPTKEFELEQQPLIVSILGAGVHLAEGLLMMYPNAPLGLVSAKRIEEGDSVRVELYYTRLPKEWNAPAIVVDPMLATGTTMSSVIDKVKTSGARKIIVASVIAARPGVSYVLTRHPDVAIFTLGLDEFLDKRNFIVPGLGDAGDRSLGVVL